jgi:hypothetical protein
VADGYCRTCGHELGDDDRFCPNCGRPVDQTASVPTPEADVPVSPPPQQDNSPLQGGAGSAKAGSAPPEMDKKEEPQEEDLSSPLDTDKRHSQVSEPQKPKIAKEVEEGIVASPPQAGGGGPGTGQPSLVQLQPFSRSVLALTLIIGAPRRKPKQKRLMFYNSIGN